jgi:hypothetical protein
VNDICSCALRVLSSISCEKGSVLSRNRHYRYLSTTARRPVSQERYSASPHLSLYTILFRSKAKLNHVHTWRYVSEPESRLRFSATFRKQTSSFGNDLKVTYLQQITFLNKHAHVLHTIFHALNRPPKRALGQPTTLTSSFAPTQPYCATPQIISRRRITSVRVNTTERPLGKSEDD